MELELLASIFEAVRVMPLRPSDLLVFRANEFLKLEQKAALHTMLEQATGHQRILILDGGAELAVLRSELEPEPAVAAAPAQPIHRPISGPASSG